MPDVTSTLLAMYQQIIGGSSAREQSALEAECARRVITSGLTIAGSGAFTLPGNVIIGGSLSVNNFSVTGTFSVPGTLTVGTLAVTANATVGGTLGVTGVSTFTAAMTVNSDVIALGTVTAGALVCTGALNLNNLLTVSGFGSHVFSAPGVGTNSIQVRNPAAGTGNIAGVWIGNDTAATLGLLQVFASSFTPAGINQPNGFSLVSTGSGGLSLGAIGAGTSLRFYSGAAIERMRLSPTGELCVNLLATFAGAKLALGFDGTNSTGIGLQSTNAVGAAAAFVGFYNASAVVQGSITGSGTTAVLYNTASDARLKIDDGRATDLAALRAVVIHEFHWRADGRADRGVLAQEAHRVFPRAVVVGTDEVTERGALTHPWMTDYSKFVPDLVVGWQQHDEVLTELRIAIESLRDRLKGAA